MTEVVPYLQAEIDLQTEQFDDLSRYVPNARRFHEALVSRCGNEPMILLIGSLELIWSAHESSVWSDDDDDGTRPCEPRCVTTRRLLDAIRDGTATERCGWRRTTSPRRGATRSPLGADKTIEAKLISRSSGTMTASTDDRVLFDVDHDKRIATITLNNPKQRNSYDAAMRDAVARCLDVVAEDDDLTVVLLRGADGVFCTGADMNNAYGWYGEAATAATAKKSRPSQRRRLTVDRKSFGFYHNLMGFPKVTVGEISGYALGGGFEMALMTDISVIARDTQIGMPATRFLGPALGSLHMFFHRLGPVLARRLLLTGDIIEAGAIEHLGVFTETCDPSKPSTARARYWAREGRQDARRRRRHRQGGVPARRAEPGLPGRGGGELPVPRLRHQPAVRAGRVQLRQDPGAARHQGGVPAA